ncbi:hypothetical protein [Alteromonas oceanisediminis]|uniref:hypothetical protein n=1 Tax=Alteromonas oceanisediminis TaxID=2836180 RepID=UPI001BDAFAF6|nr:hypothetical protein [Alteromonas oceanisediminis]MBT0586993.1 hypothetical protein [Alteromonas oceanisediminis]
MGKPAIGFLLIALIYWAIPANANNDDSLNNIKDDALRACISRALDEGSALSDVKRLKCHSEGVESLEGIALLPNLSTLSLFNNHIEHADLRELSQLTTLNLAKNRLSILNVEGLSHLENLFAFDNQLETVSLNGLSALTKLRLMQNKITELDLSNLQALESAYLFDNQLEDLSIDGLSALTFLDVKQNPMPDELYDFFDEQDGIVIVHDGNADDWK